MVKIFSLCFILFAALALFAQNNKMISFELEDQFGEVYTDNSWPGKIVILLGSDKGGSTYNEIWGKAIYDSLKTEIGFEKVQMVGLSDLSSVPFFMKWVIRGKFPEEKEKWVLMDWDGEFLEAYNFKEDAANILIFNSDKILVYQESLTEIDDKILSEILRIIKSLIN